MSAHLKLVLPAAFFGLALVFAVPISAQTRPRADAKQIRALLGRLNREGQLSDDPEVEPAGIRELEKAAEAAQEPARSILRNLTATAYLEYVHHNKPAIYGRSTTTGFKKEDIATWSLHDFREKITAEYKASLREEDLLRSTRVADYAPIVIPGNVRYLRPTLFDLLAQKALEFFVADDIEVDLPANVFVLDDPAIYADAQTFARHVFVTADTGSIHYLALGIFQRLITMHLADARPGALIDVDIERLQFVHNYAAVDDKEQWFYGALSRITDQWPDDPASTEAWYLQAEHAAGSLSYRLDLYHNYTRHNDFVKAKAICERVLAEKDSSEGKDKCRGLLEDILERKLELDVEGVNLPGKPFRLLIAWQNVPVMYGRIVRLDNSGGRRLRLDADDDSSWHKLLRLPVVRSLRQSLPVTNDYQAHSTEIAVEALPIGEYALIASGDSLFRANKEPLALGNFSVSGIAFVNDGQDYFVVDREKGTPLVNATVQGWDLISSHSAGYEVMKKAETYHTDGRGHFLMKKIDPATGRPFAFEIWMGQDHLFNPTDDYDDGFGENQLSRQEFEEDNLYFFTDRSIYRPGQTVYFKGIVIARDYDSGRPKIVTGGHYTIFLQDANNSLLDSLAVVANDYGSFHGQFHIPENTLTGEFSLGSDPDRRGGASFSVEEYKRPRFYVAFDTAKANYIVGDSARLTGYVQAFAGNRIDGATVHYRVIRQVHYFYGCSRCTELRSLGTSWAGYGPFDGNNGQEMVHGTAMTDKDGKFRIDFLTTADKTLDRSEDPVFVYTVTADVTDGTGETHNAITYAQAYYRALHLKIDQSSGEHLPVDSFKTVLIHATDPNGTDQPALVETRIYALQSPDRLIRERRWPIPDQYVLTREEFLRVFPNDEYGDDLNPRTWARRKQVFAGSDSAGRAIGIASDTGAGWRPGWYLVEARVLDQNGHWIKDSAYFELYNSLTGEPGGPQYQWYLPSEQTLQPGDSAHVSVGSSVGDIWVIRRMQRDISSTFDEFPLWPGSVAVKKFETFLLPGKGRSEKNYLVTEADRGGYGFFDVFVKDNRIFEQQHVVNVPWSNKKLDIHFTSFRDKVIPGSTEKWTVTIKNGAASEVMAGMYDASLDQFKPHSWGLPTYPNYSRYTGESFFRAEDFRAESTSERFFFEKHVPYHEKKYDALMTPALSKAEDRNVFTLEGGMPIAVTLLHPPMAHAIQVPDLQNDPDGSKGLMRDTLIQEGPPPLPPPPVLSQETVRKDFRETAFFYPELHPDSSGVVQFSFKMPEALTTWKAMVFAHTRDLASGYAEKTIVTQKELMVQPNAPRILREGDRMVFPVKVVNLTDSLLAGQVRLQLTDAVTGQAVDSSFVNIKTEQSFAIAARQSVVVNFPLEVPSHYSKPVIYRAVAQAGAREDGEEAVVPVISNRILVTESLSLNTPGAGSWRRSFDKLLVSENRATLSHHALTVEFTSNPMWMAVESLPYLMEPSYDGSEEVFDEFYANALASKLVQGSPVIWQVLAGWRRDTATLLGNLEKNQELKTVMLQETPWMLDGKTEGEQKRKLALLLDDGRMNVALASSLGRLMALQSPNGAFSWFKGGPDDRYITQYILTGLGRLSRAGAIPSQLKEKIATMVNAALEYTDGEMNKSYLWAKKHPAELPDEITVQYLYMRYLLTNIVNSIPGETWQHIQYFKTRLKTAWPHYRPYLQAMSALALYRLFDEETAHRILSSLKQQAIRNPERGTYWPGMEGDGCYWYEAPIETEALMIEAFREINIHDADIETMETWLLNNKQTHHWPSTRATAEACYALLSRPGWETLTRATIVHLGDSVVESSGEEGGYYKKVFEGPHVRPEMGNITETVTGTGEVAYVPVWGSVYWQYFEQGDSVEASGASGAASTAGGARAALGLAKKIFIRRNSSRGPVLEPLEDNGVLAPGDELIVRLELRADRDLEYVHMKDMRAAGMEPEQVLSGYRWQDGLDYYQSTGDAGTDFFFGTLPKGIYVFEYPLRAVQRGNYSNGIASIECLYAPQFSAHTQGMRITVK